MINDLKMGFKVSRYGLNLKGNIISMVIFLLCGIFMEIITPMNSSGGVYLGLCGMMLAQLVHSVAYSDIVRTSPRKRKLQTSVPSIMCGLYLLFANTISIGLKMVGYHWLDLYLDYKKAEVVNAILFSSILMVVATVYMGAALKVFWQATVVFFVVFISIYAVSNPIFQEVGWIEKYSLNLSLGWTIAGSYVIVLAGSIGMYLVNVLLYKREYSKINFKTALERAK